MSALRKEVNIYFQTISPESASIGDFKDVGEFDLISGYSVKELYEFITRRSYSYCSNYLEASSSKFHPGIWYSTVDPDIDYQSGIETYYTIHLENYSEEEELQFFNLLFNRKEVKDEPIK